MIIKGTKTEQSVINVDITPKNALIGLCSHYLTLAGIHVYLSEYECDRLFIKDGKIWKEYEESGGSHSWFSEKVILENPTVMQLDTAKYVLQLMDVYKGLELTTKRKV